MICVKSVSPLRLGLKRPLAWLAGRRTMLQAFSAGTLPFRNYLLQAVRQYGDNVVRFYEHLRENHLWATYAIVPPQIDRSKPAHKQADPALYAGVVRERDDGIVICGAQQVATGGVFSC